jgi:hypothetical protein
MHRLRYAALVSCIIARLGAGLAAQAPQPGPPPIQAVPVQPAPAGGAADLEFSQRAETTRQQIETVLREYPPGLRNILQLDPSLLTRADYLAPYPRLAAFLQMHPEVLRDPSYYFGRASFYDRPPDPVEMLGAVLAGLGVFIAFMTVMLIVAALLRQVIDYRRWLRQSRVQTEVHTKILDRLQSNEDLLAYVQTPAGRHFLESAPLAGGDEPRTVGVPLGRILWSAQAGVVLATLGLGLGFVQRNVPSEIVPAFYVMAVVSLALGVGAVVSAGAAYVLSARLGLLPVKKVES